MKSSDRVLITGGSGFIGSNLVEHYRKITQVLNVDCSAPRNPEHVDHWREANILDSNSLAAIFKEWAPTHVIHMAARTDLRGCHLQDYAANTRGVESIITSLSVCRSVRQVIFTSSMLVCRVGYRPRGTS